VLGWALVRLSDADPTARTLGTVERREGEKEGRMKREGEVGWDWRVGGKGVLRSGPTRLDQTLTG
jgi:hypothetical protein